jgi:hypothetical protein
MVNSQVFIHREFGCMTDLLYVSRKNSGTAVQGMEIQEDSLIIGHPDSPNGDFNHGRFHLISAYMASMYFPAQFFQNKGSVGPIDNRIN